MRDLNSATFLAMLLIAATTSNVCSQSLTTELSIETEFPTYAPLSQSQVELLTRPVHEWRTDAFAWTAPNVERAPADGYRLLQRALSIGTQTRDLPSEFLARVSDADLESMMFYASSEEPASGTAPNSRLRLAQEVLSRQGLAESHAEAQLERGKMMIILGANKAEITEVFASVSLIPGVAGSVSDRAQGYREAITSPSSPFGYRAANELMDLMVKYKRREVGTFQAVRVIRAVEGKGVGSLFSGENTGSLEAGRAAIRAGFEMGRVGLVRQVAAQVESRVEDNPELAAEALYFAAMTEFAEDSYAEAIPAFEKVIELVPESYFAGAALCRIGSCHIQLREYGDAVLAFDDARIAYGTSSDVAASANRQIDILIRSGLMTSYEVNEALAAPRKPRRTTTAMLSSTQGGK